MTQTKRLLFDCFLKDVADIVYGYFGSSARDPFSRGQCGEYEICCQIYDDLAFEGSIAGGHIELLEELICNGAKVCYGDNLYIAAKNGRWDAFEWLLKQPGAPSATSVKEQAIFESLSNGHLEFAQNLYNKYSPKCNLTYIYQSELFSELFKRMDEGIVKFLESLGCQWLFDRESFLACLDGDEVRVLQKIANGTFEADNCLTVACATGNERIASIVLEKLTAEKATNWRVKSQIQHAYEETCKLGHQKILGLFMPLVSDFNLQLSLANVFANGHVDCAWHLMAEWNDLFQDRMHDAFESGRCESVQTVIDYDARWYTAWQKKKVSYDKRDGFVINTNHKNTEALMLLIDNLFSEDAYDNLGGTGLFIDIQGCLLVVSKMENGADFIRCLLILAEQTKVDVDLNDCFLQACRNGHLPCVIAFLAFGKITNHGAGLFLAKSCAQLEVVELLSQTCQTLKKRKSWNICF